MLTALITVNLLDALFHSPDNIAVSSPASSVHLPTTVLRRNIHALRLQSSAAVNVIIRLNGAIDYNGRFARLRFTIEHLIISCRSHRLMS